MNLLVLFDVDGTLLLTHDEVYVEANREALVAVWGFAKDGPDVPGDTALAHTRRALRAAGIDDDGKLGEWCAVFCERYVELLRHADTSHWQLAPHARDAVAPLEHRALLTGNPEPVARARMERLGLADLFAADTGAFGCDRADRVQLFALACERAGGWPAEATVAVGDTPLDVSTSHAAGVRCVAVTTGAHGEEALADADAVIADLSQLAEALASLE